MFILETLLVFPHCKGFVTEFREFDSERALVQRTIDMTQFARQTGITVATRVFNETLEV